MLRQIKWWLQNRTITKNGVLLVTNLLFWKFYFSLITSYEELICCINNPNSHICTFCKHWSFIWRCFYPVSILKGINFRGNWFSRILRVFDNFTKISFRENYWWLCNSWNSRKLIPTKWKLFVREKKQFRKIGCCVKFHQLCSLFSSKMGT